MASIEMDRWRNFFRGSGEDLWTVIDWALSIAAIDHPQQLRNRRDRYAEKLFGQPQYPPVLSNCDGPRLEVRNAREDANKVRDSRCRVDVDDDGDEEQRPEAAEAALTTTTCSYDGDAEAVTDDHEDEELLMKREIFSVRDRLEECDDGSAEEELVGPLQRLEQMNISVEALKETGIGKVVNGLRKHSSKRVRAAALRLVRLWKHVADEWVKTASEDAAAEIAGTKASAVRNEDPVRRANPTWSDGSQVVGPNGGLIYCMDYLMKNIDWLHEKLKPLAEDHYLLFDFPGQVELFTMHNNAKAVIQEMTNKWDYRLAAVHLVDAHLCSDPGKYVSALLLSLNTMLHLELPHVNVLSKIDLIEKYGKLAFNLEYYTDVQDLNYLAERLDKNPRMSKYRKLTKGLCELVEDFALVNFTTLNIQDPESVRDLVKLIDKCNGYVFAGIEGNMKELSKIAAGPLNWDYYRTQAVQEEYMDTED